MSADQGCCRKGETVPFTTVDHSDSMVRRVSCSAMVNPEVTNMSLIARKQEVRETNRMSCCSRCSRANKQRSTSSEICVEVFFAGTSK